jgi:hypothetical protein
LHCVGNEQAMDVLTYDANMKALEGRFRSSASPASDAALGAFTPPELLAARARRSAHKRIEVSRLSPTHLDFSHPRAPAQADARR